MGTISADVNVDACTITPALDMLKAAIKAIKDADPELGAAKVHKAVKEANPTWQVSEDRVRKTIAETVVIMDGKPVKGALARAAATKMSAHELAKKKTEDALRKKREAAKHKEKPVKGSINYGTNVDY